MPKPGRSPRPQLHCGRLRIGMTPATAPAPAPGLRRRMAAFVYEGVLLFGVLMIAGLAYGLATQQRHALVGQHGLQLFLFVVLGLYLSWFWCHGGQTVAMKTWHVRLVSTTDSRSAWRAPGCATC